MKRLHRLLLALFLVPALAGGGWIDREGRPLPESGSRKSVGDFGAQLVLVGDEQVLFERWATPSESVHVPTVDRVHVDEAINAFVIFSGCAADVSGNCRVSMRFRVLDPDGSVYAATPPMEVWHDKPAPPGRSLELSVEYLKIIIEPTDPLGRYVVQVQVRDDHSGAILQLEDAFTAAAAE